jgi:hypothetical protein
LQFVKNSSISAAPTAYAKEQWPHNPREFYAEAYSYFVLNPDRLKHSSAF